MRRIITDVWTIITQSIREMSDPSQRVLAIVGVISVFAILTLLVLLTITGFIENLFEIIGNTITNTVIGEFPEVVE